MQAFHFDGRLLAAVRRALRVGMLHAMFGMASSFMMHAITMLAVAMHVIAVHPTMLSRRRTLGAHLRRGL